MVSLRKSYVAYHTSPCVWAHIYNNSDKAVSSKTTIEIHLFIILKKKRIKNHQKHLKNSSKRASVHSVLFKRCIKNCIITKASHRSSALKIVPISQALKGFHDTLSAHSGTHNLNYKLHVHTRGCLAHIRFTIFEMCSRKNLAMQVMRGGNMKKAKLKNRQ